SEKPNRISATSAPPRCTSPKMRASRENPQEACRALRVFRGADVTTSVIPAGEPESRFLGREWICGKLRDQARERRGTKAWENSRHVPLSQMAGENFATWGSVVGGEVEVSAFVKNFRG